jgi:hypothetical protein
MDNRESSCPEQGQDEDSNVQVEAVKLVEMGEVSVETKGTIHGLELGFTPRSF